jgi:hypothetical protein
MGFLNKLVCHMQKCSSSEVGTVITPQLDQQSPSAPCLRKR